jgi:hypothetical protein
MSAFTDAVAREMDRIIAVCTGSYLEDCAGCPNGLEYYDGVHYPDDSTHFSWTPCDCCGSQLGGDREVCHGLIDGELWHGNACMDCVAYLANGEEPDDWRVS